MVFVTQDIAIFTDPFCFTCFTMVKVGCLCTVPIVSETVYIDLNRNTLDSNDFSCKLADSLIKMSFLTVD